MQRDTRTRARHAAGWATIGGGAAVVTGSTPIGIAIVAVAAGALAWRALSGASRAPS